MTTTTDSAGHPDVSEISDLTEGLLSPSRTHDVRRHLDDCALCTDVYDSLEEIRGMLGTLPGVPRMPADVAERIDAALAAEALLDATATDGAGTPARGAETAEAVSQAAASESVVDVSRETSTAGASTPDSDSTVSDPVPDTPDDASDASGASGASGPSATSGKPVASVGATPGSGAPRPAGHARAATGPGRGGRLRGRRRRTAVLGAVVGAAALSLGTLLIQPWDTGSKGTTAGRSEGAHTFSEDKLEDRVSKLLAKEPSITGVGTPGPKSSVGSQSSPNGPKKGSTMQDEYVQVPACVERGLDGRTPLAADKGTYKGKSAYLVVVPHDSDGAKVSAYIVDASCVNASSSPDATGKVLLTESYARN
ncbi:hypothetical protein GCM10018785_09990 [Streptomyces longispororuber]|uniref:Zinc-finger domain-containing protein n=1 Tax=Streptomyces longispororuber TaxID=68230 RepID=A0A919DF83_9ACTN|nr:hypothetical protein [Streptomyces longispororuber]GHE42361.1 hypothetical protein GCM10018785_09990 [Streptomyces longispororuber]